VTALGQQGKPVVVHAGPNYITRNGWEILLGGFASQEMFDAYVAWLDSGAAHEAFGKWADEKEFMKARGNGSAT
jgi:hypothetical protein